MFRLRIKELREEAGLTQEHLAKALGKSKGAIGNWEAGTREPDFMTVTKIADYFGVTVDYLLGNVSEPYFHLDNERILREINELPTDGIPMAPISGKGQKKEAIPTLDEAERLYIQALLESKKLSKERPMTDEEIARMENAIRMGLRIIRDTND